MFSAVQDRVIMEIAKKHQETTSGIIVSSKEEIDRGIALAVGPEVRFVSIGDELMVNWNKATQFMYEGKSYYSVSEKDIVGIFTK